MNFKQLPKEKRNNLILVALLTAIALGAMGFGLIRFQYDHLSRIKSDTTEAARKLEQMKTAIQHADQTEAELADTQKELNSIEDGMASGDLYSWVYETVRRFKLGYRVDIPQFSTADENQTTMLLPKFPYKQVTIAVGGTGFYHDIGKFIAEFENQFPHIRLVNLTIDPATSPGMGEDREKLEFKMQIITLVRPNNPS